VQNQLSKRKAIQGVEEHLKAAAEVLWEQLERHDPVEAKRMMQYMDKIGHDYKLGNTAWNAYSINVNFRSGERERLK